MKFVSEHLTTHHLLHKPHRWFLAFLLSPIHALELHYQKRYHLQFSHARKLFIFDMLLLVSIFLIGGLASFWYWYDPTITRYVDLQMSISPVDSRPDQAGRVLSGEELALKVVYQNNGAVDLVNPVLHLNLPTGFVVNRTNQASFVSTTNSFILPDTKPKTGQEIVITGQFFALPNTDTKFASELVYHQPGQSNYEVRSHSLLGITRGSILAATISAPETIYSQGSWESELVLKNIYRTVLPPTKLSLNPPPGTTINFNKISGGELKNNEWQIFALAPGASVTSTVSITTNLASDVKDLVIDFTPTFSVNNQTFAQTPATLRSHVVRPDIALTSGWDSNKIIPGQNAKLTLDLKNTGDVLLQNVTLTISLPSGIVNSSAIRQLNNFTVKNNALVITAKEISELTSLAPGQSKNISLNIPIVNYPVGQTDLNFNLPVRVSANTAASKILFERQFNSNSIQIGSSLRIIPDAHYYSLEGDQIGRGPLPPKVGKETKYWALITVQNGTSELGNVNFSATLAPGVVWTGKTNVSRGREPVYSAGSRTFSWQTNDLPAHESAQINVELAVTPTEAQRGTIPMLLTNIRASGQDTFINELINSGPYSLDARLDSDDFAQEKGVRVQ